MRFQNVALSLVQPGNHHEFITHRNPLQPRCHRRIHFEPGIGRAFVALIGGFSTLFERRMKHANGRKGIVSLSHHAPSFISDGTRKTGWISTSRSHSPREAFTPTSR